MKCTLRPLSVQAITIMATNICVYSPMVLLTSICNESRTVQRPGSSTGILFKVKQQKLPAELTRTDFMAASLSFDSALSTSSYVCIGNDMPSGSCVIARPSAECCLLVRVCNIVECTLNVWRMFSTLLNSLSSNLLLSPPDTSS
jgi:hypothetical protein